MMEHQLTSNSILQVNTNSSTKDTFDSLLKQALTSKNVKNVCNRIIVDSRSKKVTAESIASTRSSTTTHNREKVEIIQAEVYEQVGNSKNFILSKFLSDTANLSAGANVHSTVTKDPDIFCTIPPIPKPRLKLIKPVTAESNDGTYVVEPVICKENLEQQINKKVSNDSLNSEAPDSFKNINVDRENGLSKAVLNIESEKFENETSISDKQEVDEFGVIYPIGNTSNITAVTIHKADCVNLDSLYNRLVVKVHIVNRKTGEYLQSTNNSNEPVAFYIMPITTAYNNSHERQRYLIPKWEETLNIYEDINYILKKENKSILFFEILYMLNEESCNKIAWAFLKLLGKNGELNTEKCLRLQLYYPNIDYKNVPGNFCNMFHWWKSKKLIKYPSTLYVSIRNVKVQELNSLKVNNSLDNIYDQNDDKKLYPWSRIQYQICKLPNKCLSELPTYEEGCLVMKFSNNGSYLAYAILIEDVYTIVIYSMHSFQEIYKYSAHQGLIYSIAWSKDDCIIVTASADCTVGIWNFLKRTYIEVLPHPSYIYTASINNNNIIATGCYDTIVRIWTFSETASLVQELVHHEGYITCVCFNRKATMLYSADSIGIIIEWAYTNTWIIRREIKLIDLQNTIINQILLHKRERRLIISARDSALRVMDIKTACVMCCLQGGLNNKFQSVCSLSSCGTYVVSGSENSHVNVWNIDTGQHIATYNNGNSNIPILCVEFHPKDNIMAISRYFENLPILLLAFDTANQSTNDVGFLLLESETVRQYGLNLFKDSVLSVCEKRDPSRRPLHKLEKVIQKIDRLIVIPETSSKE